MSARQRKYEVEQMVKAFRLFAAARKAANDVGIPDNAGAIHSCERILNLLGMRLNYPNVGHINNQKHHSQAKFSIAAKAAYEKGDKVLIEHVAPLRHFTQLAIKLITDGADDDALIAFVRKHYVLVHLTPDEASRLNKHNRSKVVTDRLGEVGIRLAK